jgi:hypothetical protein
MKLTWDDRNLWRLVVKRAIDSACFAEWLRATPVMPELTSGAVESAGEPALHPYLDRLFDRHIWTGKNSLSRNWILRRLADARGVIYPRDLICLFGEALGKESERIAEGSRWYEFDLTTLVRQWSAIPDSNYGLIVLAAAGDSNANVEARFVSREGTASWRPQLVISYSLAAGAGEQP